MKLNKYITFASGWFIALVPYDLIVRALMVVSVRSSRGSVSEQGYWEVYAKTFSTLWLTLELLFVAPVVMVTIDVGRHHIAQGRKWVAILVSVVSSSLIGFFGWFSSHTIGQFGGEIYIFGLGFFGLWPYALVLVVAWIFSLWIDRRKASSDLSKAQKPADNDGGKA